MCLTTSTSKSLKGSQRPIQENKHSWRGRMRPSYLLHNLLSFSRECTLNLEKTSSVKAPFKYPLMMRMEIIYNVS